MTHDEIRAHCLRKPGAYLDHPFGPASDIIKVKAPSQQRGRIFAQLFFLRGQAVATLNCGRMEGELWRGLYPGAVARGWHCPPVQQPYFNTIALDGTVPDDELLLMIDHAYDVVAHKLPKAAQRELIPAPAGRK
ncbi:MAG: MmcQ/YjbR family DNA-binding protein [Oscillospiraceae bacterium]|jgi:predicted DNA-binding protein (MmcQ/YjbR family)|nr:MmcQ/YjbR family DNA-binding protein [Oscillospiraceae bacterium]